MCDRELPESSSQTDAAPHRVTLRRTSSCHRGDGPGFRPPPPHVPSVPSPTSQNCKIYTEQCQEEGPPHPPPGRGVCCIRASFRNWNVGCRWSEGSPVGSGSRPHPHPTPPGPCRDNPAPIRGMNFILISTLSAATPFGRARDTLSLMRARFNSQSQQEPV